jgi:lipopolysaccharide export LptBFGC system permease protein LptF
VGSRGIFLSSDVNFYGLVRLSKGTNMLPGVVAAWIPPVVFFIASGFLINRARR